jgi:hypothetical protein
MKVTIAIGAVILAAVVFGGTSEIASAQSDRTLGITCTVAGHEHCRETGPLGGYHHRHWRHHYGAFAYAGNCRVNRHRFETPSGRIIYRSTEVCG